MSTATRVAEQWWRFADSDLLYRFRKSPITVVAAVVAVTIMLAAFLAPWIAPHDPFDIGTFSLLNSSLPPAWMEGGKIQFLLGTDVQGRDVLSVILYGAQISILVGIASVLVSMIVGVTLGMVSAYLGGTMDAIIMRIADVMISFPAILVALLINGVARGVLPPAMQNNATIFVLIIAISATKWVQYARIVRGSTLVEKNREYVLAARIMGLRRTAILVRHILPNVLSPILVVATINFAIAILLEAALSFLGVGMPPTEPSLGTLIRIGNDYLFSGLWWIVIFPSATLVLLVLSINLLGDWLRDALNPKLR